MRPVKAALIAGATLLAIAYYGKTTQRVNDTSNSAVTNLVGGTINFFNGGAMQISNNGRAQIERREGYRNTVYADVAGNQTAGIGHLLTRADGYNIGDYVADTVIQSWFNSDISHVENIMARYITVPLNQNQIDALGSAVFNLGSRLFINADGSKTHILADLISGNMQAAAAQLPLWDHAGGVTVPGLYARRVAEMNQFLA